MIVTETGEKLGSMERAEGVDEDDTAAEAVVDADDADEADDAFTSDEDEEPEDLSKLSKADLVELAEAAGVDSAGLTKANLVEALTSDEEVAADGDDYVS